MVTTLCTDRKTTCAAVFRRFRLPMLLCLLLHPVSFAELVMRYDRPARDWETEALPIGNGRQGAMLFGQMPVDRIQFNDITLWTGHRDLMGAYQAFGDVYVELKGHDFDRVRDYARSLDLSRGMHTVVYTLDGVEYRREAFASYPDGVIVQRYSAADPGRLTGSVRLTDMHDARITADGNRITATGVLTEAMGRGEGDAPTMDYESQVWVRNEGGTVRATDDGSILFEGCDAVTILLGTGTSFVLDHRRDLRGPHPHEALTQRMADAFARSFTDLYERHDDD